MADVDAFSSTYCHKLAIVYSCYHGGMESAVFALLDVGELADGGAMEPWVLPFYVVEGTRFVRKYERIAFFELSERLHDYSSSIG